MMSLSVAPVRLRRRPARIAPHPLLPRLTVRDGRPWTEADYLALGLANAVDEAA